LGTHLVLLYQGLPNPLPPNTTTYNTNYFTTISNTIYSSEGDKVDSCEKCESDINIEPTRNFLVSVIKDDVQITEIQPVSFYQYDNQYNFPVAALTPMYGTQYGLNNQTVTVTIYSNDITPVCVSLVENGNIIASLTGSFLAGGEFINVVFLGVTVASTSTLEIIVNSGSCQ
jgi:hypothetical protein